MMRRATKVMRDASEFTLLYTLLNLIGWSTVGTFYSLTLSCLYSPCTDLTLT